MVPSSGGSTTIASPTSSASTSPTADALLRRLSDERDREKKSTRAAILLEESLDLLEEEDQRIIGLWLSEPEASDVAARLKFTIEEARERYEAAIDRLQERLAWVLTRECRGISPPERKATGHVKFLGRSAQAVADQLRLPLEVVEIWLHEVDPIP